MVSKIKWFLGYPKKLKKMMAEKQEKINELKAYINAPMNVKIKNNILQH